MPLKELLARLLTILPNLLVDEESDGEVLIYAGFRQTAEGRLERVAPSDSSGTVWAVAGSAPGFTAPSICG